MTLTGHDAMSDVRISDSVSVVPVLQECFGTPASWVMA